VVTYWQPSSSSSSDPPSDDDDDDDAELVSFMKSTLQLITFHAMTAGKSNFFQVCVSHSYIWKCINRNGNLTCRLRQCAHDNVAL
jgi:hypothetical protein